MFILTHRQINSWTDRTSLMRNWPARNMGRENYKIHHFTRLLKSNRKKFCPKMSYCSWKKRKNKSVRIRLGQNQPSQYTVQRFQSVLRNIVLLNAVFVDRSSVMPFIQITQPTEEHNREICFGLKGNRYQTNIKWWSPGIQKHIPKLQSRLWRNN